jgi:DNA gyrase/topoisomerase IV subunit A
VHPIDIDHEMQQAYLSYAMSVIVSRIAQDFSMRYLLVDGQGNFCSVGVRASFSASNAVIWLSAAETSQMSYYPMGVIN